MYLINQESYSLILQPDGHFYFEEPKQIGVETKLVVEKQEKRVGFTLQASKKMVELQMRLFDSIRNRKHRSSERFKKFGKRN